MGMANRRGGGSEDGEGARRGGDGEERPDLLPLLPPAPPAPARPRWTTTIPLHLEGGQPYTVITRAFRPGDVASCGRCPRGRCVAHEGVCTLVVPGHLDDGAAAAYSVAGALPTTAL
jgi:hypothetical protein